MMFQRHFPGCKISVYKLRKLYYQHKIKIKKIRKTKSIPVGKEEKIHLEAIEAKIKLR